MTRLGTTLLLLGTVFAIGQDRPPTITPARGAYVEPQPILLRYDFTATELEDPEPVASPKVQSVVNVPTNCIAVLTNVMAMETCTNAFTFSSLCNATNTYMSAFDERDERIKKLEARLAALETQLKEKP